MIKNSVVTSPGGWEALASAVILDAARSYALCLTNKNKGKIARDREIYSCERFFNSKAYLMYAECINLNLSGLEILSMIRRDPYRFAERLREKEKRAWRNNV